MTTTAPRGERIDAPVGAGGTNTPSDVRVVQDLLNRAAKAQLSVDGVCGPQTRAAIVDYQSTFLKNPDGRVDPDGQTLRRLVDAARTEDGKPTSDPAAASGPRDGLRLQQFGGSQHGGWYSYSSADRQFGTDVMIRVLLDVAATLHRAGLQYGVGDISFAQGGLMKPHTSHQKGRNADLRPIRNDASRGPTSIGDPTYSRENTLVLVRALQADASVTQILFNDTEIPGVRTWAGHHNHLHIQVR
jgi:hypothetical protein